MNAKKFALVTAGLCATMFFAACDSTEKQSIGKSWMAAQNTAEFMTAAPRTRRSASRDAGTAWMGVNLFPLLRLPGSRQAAIGEMGSPGRVPRL